MRSLIALGLLSLLTGCTVKVVDLRFDPDRMQQIVNALSNDTGNVAKATVAAAQRIQLIEELLPEASKVKLKAAKDAQAAKNTSHPEKK